MVDTHLFEAETHALERAQNAVTAEQAEPQFYRQALNDLIRHYRRLMRETHRLIQHGDRTEAELNAVNAKLQQLSAELDYKARHDSLTGILNRSAIFDLAQRHLKQGPMSLVLLDIDFFKRINDTFGHPAGDAVLQELVVRLSETLDGRGEVGRVGGEEFTILLPGRTLMDSVAIAESIRANIAKRSFSQLFSHPVTASFGVSFNLPGTPFETAYAEADAALYRSKNQGRNQVNY
ncbi:MAG TPA: GGDEF domain-containing protein [Pusillimonas sp.]|uniref:GGDEF domain-containing protein n=1 Tax=Pusillimonas sp. TaxID=3040095 RepID=UPI002B6DDC17|nr:GGDEF domain-containing protein [Pusillimonas sp.]HUH87765.1 GGDEF domain-containing protein [Pusillimonas sp.]